MFFLKYIGNHREPQRTKAILIARTEMEASHFLNSKHICKVTAIKRVGVKGIKTGRQTHRPEEQLSKTFLHTETRTFTDVLRLYNGERIVSFSNQQNEKTSYSMEKIFANLIFEKGTNIQNI